MEQTQDKPERSAHEILKEMLSRPYVWPVVGGQRARQGDCSSCRQVDKRHPEGRACDYSCVGI